MSINNRKYIQSTGSLLARLNEESSNPAYQHQHAAYQNVNTQSTNYNRLNPQAPYQQNSGYSNMQQYSTGSQGHGMYGNSFGSSGQMFPAGQVPVQAAAIAAQLVNKINVYGHQSMGNQYIYSLGSNFQIRIK